MEWTYWEVWPWWSRCGLDGVGVALLEYVYQRLWRIRYLSHDQYDILSLLPADPDTEFSALSVPCLPTHKHTFHRDDEILNPWNKSMPPLLSSFLIVCLLNYSYPTQQLQLHRYKQCLGPKNGSLKKFCSLSHRLFQNYWGNLSKSLSAKIFKIQRLSSNLASKRGWVASSSPSSPPRISQEALVLSLTPLYKPFSIQLLPTTSCQLVADLVSTLQVNFI